VQYTREGSLAGPANHIVLGTLGMPLPLWQSNQSERARTRVDAEVAHIEEAASAQRLRLAIAHAHSELQSASARIELFNSTIKPALETGLTSLQRGFAAGEIGARDFALAGERFLSVERDALAAHADYVTALSELESALGGPIEGASRGPADAEPQ
jgi:outer membrane protein TolC